MKRKTKITYLIILLFFVSAVSINSVQASNIVLSPSYIEIRNVLKGADPYERTIYIDNTGDIDGNVLLNFTGEIKDWITFYPFSNLSTPINTVFVKNNSYEPLIMKIAIPPDAQNGFYYGNITAKKEFEETNTSGAQVTVGSKSLVILGVTGDQILNISVEQIIVSNCERNYNSQITVIFENIGNVKATPLIEVKFNRVGGKELDSISSKDSFDAVRPGQRGTYKMLWNTSQAQLTQYGTYEAHFNISLDGEIVYQETVPFEIFDKETFKREGKFEELTYQGDLEKGKSVNIIANFTNTGEIEIDATFYGKIYRNGELIHDFNSDKVNVPILSRAYFESNVPIEENGNYEVKGYVHYRDILNSEISSNTKILSLTFTVGPTFPLDITQLLLILFIIIFIIVIYVIKRKKRVIEVTKVKSKRIKTTKPKKEKKPKKHIHLGRNKEKSPFKPKKQKKNTKNDLEKDSIGSKIDDLISDKKK